MAGVLLPDFRLNRMARVCLFTEVGWRLFPRNSRLKNDLRRLLGMVSFHEKNARAGEVAPP